VACTLLSVPPAIYANKKIVALVLNHFDAKINGSRNNISNIDKNNSVQMKGESSRAGGPPTTVLPGCSPDGIVSSSSSPSTNVMITTTETKTQIPQQQSNSVQLQFDLKDRCHKLTLKLKNQKIEAVKSRMKLLMNLTNILGVSLMVAIILSELAFRESMSG
jgi:hypothetical protein